MKREIISVRLDTVPVYRNKTEYRPINRAQSGTLTVTGDGKIVKQVLKQRYEQGADLEAIVEVYRGNTLCFTPTPLKSWVIPRENAIKKRCRG